MTQYDLNEIYIISSSINCIHHMIRIEETVIQYPRIWSLGPRIGSFSTMDTVKPVVNFLLIIGVTLGKAREEVHRVQTQTEWETEALRELVTNKSSMISCPTREYRLENPQDIKPWIRWDGAEITSLLQMVNSESHSVSPLFVFYVIHYVMKHFMDKYLETVI